MDAFPAEPVDTPAPKRILVVDQDQLFARIVKAKLEKWGYAVHLERNGTAALRWLSVEDFRIVITDVNLPGLSGPDLCRAIRAGTTGRYTYIIFYTAQSDKASLLAGLEAGADDYMPKPFNASELRLRLNIAERILGLDDELYHGGGLDRLTGTFSRNAFLQLFPTILAQYVRTASEGALAFITVANYGQVLRSRGFHAAQAMVRSLVTPLRRAHRQSDLLAKLGDNEYCIMLQNTRWQLCEPVFKRLADGLREAVIEDEGVELRPIVDLTAINFPDGRTTVEEVMDPRIRQPIGRLGEADAALSLNLPTL